MFCAGRGRNPLQLEGVREAQWEEVGLREAGGGQVQVLVTTLQGHEGSRSLESLCCWLTKCRGPDRVGMLPTVPSAYSHPQHGVLSQQFVELINKCNAMQSEYREKNVERIRRQLKISELWHRAAGWWA